VKQDTSILGVEKRTGCENKDNHIIKLFNGLLKNAISASISVKRNATLPNCGNPLRDLNTTFVKKFSRGTRLIAEPNGKNSEIGQSAAKLLKSL
jgi:hypothetical protein